MAHHRIFFAVLVFAAACHATTPPGPTVAPEKARAAVTRSLPLLQKSADIWIKRRECMSCHHTMLGALAVATARRQGIPIDQALFYRQLARMAADKLDSVDAALAGFAVINGQVGFSYFMLAQSGVGVSDFPLRAATVHYVAG